MEERERKLQDLQRQLMAEYTFTPKSVASNHSATSSITAMTASPDPTQVFDRLYNRETAAMRARREATHNVTGTPSYVGAREGKNDYVTPSRVAALYSEGQDRLRARLRTDEVNCLGFLLFFLCRWGMKSC